MEFEWDDIKAEVNLKKHGIRFSEAATIWLDNSALEMPDPELSPRGRTLDSSWLLQAGPGSSSGLCGEDRRRKGQDYFG